MKKKLTEWYDLTCGHDPQTYQDLEWDWEEELFNFISDPDAALKDAEEKFS